MTTITYDLQVPVCSGAPYFKEDDYSIHLQNRLSPQEFKEAVHSLNEIVRGYYPKRSLIWIMILLMLVPWFLYIFLFFTKGWSISLFIITILLQYIPLITWLIYYFRHLRMMCDNTEYQIGIINQKYYNRGINFRLLTSSSVGNTGNRAYFALQIEISQPTMPVFQASPQMFNPANYTVPLKYTP